MQEFDESIYKIWPAEWSLLIKLKFLFLYYIYWLGFTASLSATDETSGKVSLLSKEGRVEDNWRSFQSYGDDDGVATVVGHGSSQDDAGRPEVFSY